MPSTSKCGIGAGAYVCGEETSLLESLEGKRGMVRAKPPLPAHKGLFGKPTVINNVLSLAAVPFILAEGAKAYADYGMGRSRGTMPIQLAGNVKHGGLFETAFGITLGELVDDIGGGTAIGPAGQGGAGRRPARRLLPARAVRHAVRLRGLRRARRADRPRRHRGVRRHASTWREQARFAIEFCAIESCGKCTPCRIGSTRGVETIDKIIAGEIGRRPTSRWSTTSATR